MGFHPGYLCKIKILLILFKENVSKDSFFYFTYCISFCILVFVFIALFILYFLKNYVNTEDLKTHSCERYEVILPHQNPDYAIKPDSLTFTSDMESELEAHTVIQENGEIIIYVTQKGEAEQTQVL